MGFKVNQVKTSKPGQIFSVYTLGITMEAHLVEKLLIRTLELDA